MILNGKKSALSTALVFGAFLFASVMLAPNKAEAVGTAMRVLERTSPPAGHVYYCANEPKACLRYGQGAVRLTPQSWQQLIAINDRINSSIKPVEDGQIDRWSPYVKEGDCEDFALTKQRELIRAGWPSDALLITTAFLPDGVYHAVLVVRTDRGEFILDNLNKAVLPWQQVPYRWNKRQAVGNPQIWLSIAGAPAASSAKPVASLR